jgi:hypothetical protein
MEQLALAASVLPHAFVPVAIAKSLAPAPPMVMLLTFSVAFPELVSVAANGVEVVPAVVPGKGSAAVSVAIGAAAVVPVPDNVEVCVVGEALYVTVSVAA